MPTRAVYKALPEGQKLVMQETHIIPIINRRRDYCYCCETCGCEWSVGDTLKLGLFWWACPRRCNWDAKPAYADIMRQAMRQFLITSLITYQAQPQRGNQEGRRSRLDVKSDSVTLEEWSQHVDQLVAEIHTHHQNEPREEQ
jgi:hypothetical protein